METSTDKIFSVSEFVQLLNIGLKTSKAKIVGEVGEAKAGPTGHVYFTLKDEKDGAMLNCIIWKSRYLMYGIKIAEGMKIVAFGYPEIYPLSGRLSFIAETIELAGQGELKKQYDELKERLAKEGIFAQARKRPIPKYIQKIGVITSLQGAVIADFCNNLGKFGFKVKMIDSRVEGQQAVADLLAALKTFKKQDIEALVIMRGGGSLESMMAFNNELLVRQAADFPVPVIAAIGHDKDAPLLALAADLAVSTPSIAATVLTESWEQALLFVERYERSIFSRYEDFLENYKDIENKLKLSLWGFKNALLNAKISLRNLLSGFLAGFNMLLEKAKRKLKYAEKVAALNNPERQLRLGYSIAAIDGKIVRRTRDAEIGKDINIRVSDGEIISQVKKING